MAECLPRLWRLREESLSGGDRDTRKLCHPIQCMPDVPHLLRKSRSRMVSELHWHSVRAVGQAQIEIGACQRFFKTRSSGPCCGSLLSVRHRSDGRGGPNFRYSSRNRSHVPSFLFIRSMLRVSFRRNFATDGLLPTVIFSSRFAMSASRVSRFSLTGLRLMCSSTVRHQMKGGRCSHFFL